MGFNFSDGFGAGLPALIAAIVAAVVSQNLYVGLGVFMLGAVYAISLAVTVFPVLGMIAWWYGMNYATPILIATLHIPTEVLYIVHYLYWLDFAIGIFVMLFVSSAIFVKLAYHSIKPPGVSDIAYTREMLEYHARKIMIKRGR